METGPPSPLSKGFESPKFTDFGDRQVRVPAIQMSVKFRDFVDQYRLSLLPCRLNAPEGGGGYCHTGLYICAAVKGMVFKQFTLG